MKTYLLTSTFLISYLLNAQQGSISKDNSSAEITFEKNSHSFGKVIQGTVCTYDFKFKNTGTAPLLILEAPSSCGCAATEWSKEPILPGKYGTIRYSIMTAGRPGSFTKSFTVRSNAKNGTLFFLVCGLVASDFAEYSSNLSTGPDCNCGQQAVPQPDTISKTSVVAKEDTTPIKVSKNNIVKPQTKVDLVLLSIYPNPASEKIEVKSNEDNILNFSLYNSAGQLIYTQYFSVPVSLAEIQVSNQPTGNYILQIKTADAITRKKLVIGR